MRAKDVLLDSDRAEKRPVATRTEPSPNEFVIRAATLRKPLVDPPNPPDRRLFAYMEEDIEN